MGARMNNRRGYAVTGITLSEAWKRTAKAPRPPLRAGLSPSRAALAREHHYRLRCLPGKSRIAWSSAAGKKIPLRRDPKSPLQLPPSRTR